MKHINIIAPRWFYTAAIFFCLGVTSLYVFRVTTAYRGVVQYQHFMDLTLEKKLSAEQIAQHSPISNPIIQAIRYDPNHPEYYYALGNYLYETFAEAATTNGSPELIVQGLNEAEIWLRKAILFDPSDPWPYYQLGRLSYYRGDCQELPHLQEDSGEKQDCPAAQYFSLALQKAPKNIFLRKAIGLWYYYYDQTTAIQLMRNLIAGDARNVPDDPRTVLQFAQFLYDIGLDYESDLQAEYLTTVRSPICTANILNNSSDQHVIEVGTDDGTAEWSSALTLSSARVKKTLCLPKNHYHYQYAALKVFMNNGGRSNFTAQFSIDEHVIKEYRHLVPRAPAWHEIPFDIEILRGKTQVNAYIRVFDASSAGNYLQIWGDQDTPNTGSVFNFNITDDLSNEKGKQTGEYLIRLVLKKTL